VQLYGSCMKRRLASLRAFEDIRCWRRRAPCRRSALPGETDELLAQRRQQPCSSRDNPSQQVCREKLTRT
jgi:hypothetical protein